MRDSWEETLPWFQAQLIAYNQVREHEEIDLLISMRSVNMRL